MTTPLQSSFSVATDQLLDVFVIFFGSLHHLLHLCLLLHRRNLLLHRLVSGLLYLLRLRLLMLLHRLVGDLLGCLLSLFLLLHRPNLLLHRLVGDLLHLNLCLLLHQH